MNDYPPEDTLPEWPTGLLSFRQSLTLQTWGCTAGMWVGTPVQADPGVGGRVVGLVSSVPEGRNCS